MSDSKRKTVLCSQAVKKIILAGSTSKCLVSKKTETLNKKLRASNKGSEYYRNCEETSNLFCFSTPATAVAKVNSSQSKRKICSGGGDWKSLEKGFNIDSLYKKYFCKKSVCKESISSKEKGWGKQCFHQLKQSKSVHPPLHFKMESLQSLRDILKQINFMCRFGLLDAYFCIPLAEESKKFMRFCWEEDLQSLAKNIGQIVQVKKKS